MFAPISFDSCLVVWQLLKRLSNASVSKKTVTEAPTHNEPISHTARRRRQSSIHIRKYGVCYCRCRYVVVLLLLVTMFLIVASGYNTRKDVEQIIELV